MGRIRVFRKSVSRDDGADGGYRDTVWRMPLGRGTGLVADIGFLVWSDIPNNRMLHWTPDLGVSVFRADANFSNGNTRDREGRLVTCEHGGRRVT